MKVLPAPQADREPDYWIKGKSGLGLKPGPCSSFEARVLASTSFLLTVDSWKLTADDQSLIVDLCLLPRPSPQKFYLLTSVPVGPGFLVPLLHVVTEAVLFDLFVGNRAF